MAGLADVTHPDVGRRRAFKSYRELAVERPSILVVEDDRTMGPLIVSGLIRARFSAELTSDAAGAMEVALTRSIALILLDLGLPDGSGFDVLETLRHRSSTPILVLTARKDLEARLRSFELGAVDWVSKPFYMEELLARIHARLGSRPDAHRVRALRAGPLEIQLDSRRVCLGGEVVPLTPIEYNILTYLVERRARAISRQTLVEATLPPSSAQSDRTVDSHVAHLRQKLGAFGNTIATVWGIGYRFDSPLQPDPDEDFQEAAVRSGGQQPRMLGTDIALRATL